MAKNTSKKWLWILSILSILLLITGLWAKKQGWIGKKILTKISVETASQRTIIETVSASGKIYPEIEVKISPDVSGEIVDLLIEEGDSVAAGQLLARVKPDMYNSMVEQAQATVNSSQANASNAAARIKQLEIQKAQQERDLKRLQQLYDDQVIARTELQTAETALLATQAEIEASKDLVSAARYNTAGASANLKEAKNNLSKTNIYAPMSGIISRLDVEKGERVVGTSQFQGTEMMRIANFKVMEVRVDVSENDIVKVKLGDTAIVEVDAYMGKKFKGIVTQIMNANASTAAAAVTSTTDQVTNYTVKIRLMKDTYQELMNKESSFPFRPGMSASAKIQTKTLRNILTVPIQSVATREITDSLKQQHTTTTLNSKAEDEEDMLEVVFVHDNGKVYQREVSIGIQDEQYIEVRQGLKAGEQVVSAPYRAITKTLKDSTAVEVVKKEDLFKTGDENKDEIKDVPE